MLARIAAEEEARTTRELRVDAARGRADVLAEAAAAWNVTVLDEPVGGRPAVLRLRQGP